MAGSIEDNDCTARSTTLGQLGLYWEKSFDLGRMAQTSCTATNLLSVLSPMRLYRALRRNFRRPDNVVMRETAYLDGLRGVAAFTVYVLHHEGRGHSAIAALGLESPVRGGHFYFATLPFIRLFFSGGHVAVTIFFVISGYVLSVKPISLLHAKEHASLHRNLGSALFRRWVRLFLPVIVISFLYLNSWWIFDVRLDIRAATYFDEIARWVRQFIRFTDPLESNWKFAYQDHAWSIPVEYRGSLIVYASVLALSHVRCAMRLLCLLGLICYFLFVIDGSYAAQFLAGTLICELDQLATRGTLPAIVQRLTPVKTWPYIVVLLFGLYVGGIPEMYSNIENMRTADGWTLLSYLTPLANIKAWYRFLSAVCLVVAIPRIRTVRSFFESDPIQYLGKISYAFYLVHGPIMWTIGDRLYVATGSMPANTAGVSKFWPGLLTLPHRGPAGLELDFLIPHLILLPLTIFCADLATKYIDEPSVKLAQRLFRSVEDREDVLPRVRVQNAELS